MRYTCNEYRREMILLGLQRRLATEELTEEERRRLATEIDRLQAEMDMD